MRQEFRFSLYGKNLENAVKSVLHLFASTDFTPMEAFVAMPDDGNEDQERVEWKMHVMSYEELSGLVADRFALADKIHEAVFYGRSNEQPPSELVFPVLADLANTLGFHYGQR
jgi:hypothetical protein